MEDIQGAKTTKTDGGRIRVCGAPILDRQIAATEGADWRCKSGRRSMDFSKKPLRGPSGTTQRAISDPLMRPLAPSTVASNASDRICKRAVGISNLLDFDEENLFGIEEVDVNRQCGVYEYRITREVGLRFGAGRAARKHVR
jgi:hypothetical protein